MKHKSKSEGHKKFPSRFNYKNFHQKSLFLCVNFLQNLISNEKEKQINKIKIPQGGNEDRKQNYNSVVH